MRKGRNNISAAVTSAVLAASMSAYLSSALHGVEDAVVSAHDEAMEQKAAEEAAAAEEERRNNRPMPSYLQIDGRWASERYSAGTIGTYGCGLTAAAMAFEHLSCETVTPSDLRTAVGDSCLSGGVNDMRKFCDYGAERWGFGHSGIYFDVDEAMDSVGRDSVVFASVAGTFGDSWYGGHIVLIWKVDGDDVYVMDPASAGNSSRTFSRSYMRSVGFAYFYTIYEP